MNRAFFYPKLAWMGIAKNRKTSLPYLLTCIGMVAMFYIVAYLSRCDLIRTLRGAEYVATMLTLGTYIIGAFSVIFLFYTNSFLVRRRKKEFGLYNILGMGKWNLGRILGWETLMTAILSLSLGLACGILFSKLGELGMANLLDGDISFTFTIDTAAVVHTLALYAVIFLLILLNTLRQIHVSKPVELLRSENFGEKPPKTNWVLALLGVVILAGAYSIAVTIPDPIAALVMFFVAVLMVIVSTYMLFVAGSVAVCRLLQKNKRYYYRTNHFVSVSSMVYRMKRNGAGLASICILSTMILVMLSSTVCLFMGSEDGLRTRYPRSIIVDASYAGETPDTQAVRDSVAEVLKNGRMDPENVLDYRFVEVPAIFDEDQVTLNAKGLTFTSSGQTRQLFFVPLEDYNRLAGAQETLDKGEALVYCTKGTYPYDTLTLGDDVVLRVKKAIPEFVSNGVDAMQLVASVFVFVPNYDEMAQTVNEQLAALTSERVYRHDYYAFDLDIPEEQQIFVRDEIASGIRDILNTDARFTRISVESRAKERTGFYAMNGGFFFLGVLLGIVFLFATVLIMYYKQITEGYEDESRFDIMQKVGMTPQEIKRSVNSQVLTVFFLPLVTAGIHVAFAFPMIAKLLLLFSLTNVKLFTLVTLGCFLVFALFYILVYRITSYAYLKIISGDRKRWA